MSDPTHVLNFTLSGVTELFSPVDRTSQSVFGVSLTYLLVQLPILPRSHSLKVTVEAPEHARLQANAAMLGAMRFNGELISECQQNMAMVSRLHRTLMQLSGYALRIVDLYDVADLVNAKFSISTTESRRKNLDENHSIMLNGVDVCTPSGEKLISRLDICVAPGMHTLVWGV